MVVCVYRGECFEFNLMNAFPKQGTWYMQLTILNYSSVKTKKQYDRWINFFLYTLHTPQELWKMDKVKYYRNNFKLYNDVNPIKDLLISLTKNRVK